MGGGQRGDEEGMVLPISLSEGPVRANVAPLHKVWDSARHPASLGILTIAGGGSAGWSSVPHAWKVPGQSGHVREATSHCLSLPSSLSKLNKHVPW